MDENENWPDDQNFILQVFTQEFKKRFRKDLNSNIHLTIPLSTNTTNIDNAQLIREITMEEV